jgi:hypothetical protein
VGLSCRPGLFRLDARGADDAAVALVVGRDGSGEARRILEHRRAADGGEALAHRGVPAGLLRGAIEPCDKAGIHALRPPHPVPHHEIEARHPLLGPGRDLGRDGAALPRADGEGAQAPGPHMRQRRQHRRHHQVRLPA